LAACTSVRGSIWPSSAPLHGARRLDASAGPEPTLRDAKYCCVTNQAELYRLLVDKVRTAVNEIEALMLTDV
jgi:hypothetical protein